MKKILLLTGFLAFTAIAFAQTDLENKQKALEEANAQLKVAQSNVDVIKGEIAKLTPIPAWKKGGFASLNFNQVSFTNWAAGGQDAISTTFIGNAFAKYKKDRTSWDNNLDITYGLLKNKSQNLRKNEDKIDFYSKVGVSATKTINWAGVVNFKSQFADGYNFNDPDEKRPVISKFMAPAYLVASIGIDWKPYEFLSLFISPATGKYTFVTGDSIAATNL